MFITLKSAIWSRAICERSIRARCCGSRTADNRQCQLVCAPAAVGGKDRWGPTGCPHQIRLPVSPSLEICHEAVDDMRLRRQDVQRSHVWIRLSPMFNLFDVYMDMRCLAPVEQMCFPLVPLLVTLRLRMSSSFTALSISFLLVSSTTRTFHYTPVAISPRIGSSEGLFDGIPRHHRHIVSSGG